MRAKERELSRRPSPRRSSRRERGQPGIALRIARAATGCRVLLYGETFTDDLDTRLDEVAFTPDGTTISSFERATARIAGSRRSSAGRSS